ncbi:MAG: hypothetical protein WC718_04985, partial [Phycisphaerales bacterium]
MKIRALIRFAAAALCAVMALSTSALAQSLRIFYKDSAITSPSNSNILFDFASNFHLSPTGNVAFIATGVDSSTFASYQSYFVYDVYDHLSEVQHTGEQLDVGCSPAGIRELLTAEPVNGFDNTFLNGHFLMSRADPDYEVLMCPSTFNGLSSGDGGFRVNIWRRLYLTPSGPITSNLGYDISRCGSGGNDVCSVTSSCEVATLSQGNWVLIQRVDAFPRMTAYNLATETVNPGGE